MGCDESKDTNLPILLGFFEPGREDQKEYCLRLKDNFRHEQSIRFQISSPGGASFSIQLKIKGKTEPIKIQETFDSSDYAMNEALGKMYKILDENKYNVK